MASYPGSAMRGYPNRAGVPKLGGVRRGGRSTGVGGNAMLGRRRFAGPMTEYDQESDGFIGDPGPSFRQSGADRYMPMGSYGYASGASKFDTGPLGYGYNSDPARVISTMAGRPRLDEQLQRGQGVLDEANAAYGRMMAPRYDSGPGQAFYSIPAAPLRRRFQGPQTAQDAQFDVPQKDSIAFPGFNGYDTTAADRQNYAFPDPGGGVYGDPFSIATAQQYPLGGIRGVNAPPVTLAGRSVRSTNRSATPPAPGAVPPSAPIRLNGVGGAMGGQGSMLAPPAGPMQSVPPIGSPITPQQGWWDSMFRPGPAMQASPGVMPNQGSGFSPSRGMTRMGDPYDLAMQGVQNVRERFRGYVPQPYVSPPPPPTPGTPFDAGRGGYGFGGPPQPSPVAPYGAGGAGDVMERSRMPSQPVDGRYAVAPRGQYAQGGRYVQPGPAGRSQSAAVPDTRSIPGIGPDGTGFMMIGGRRRQFVQLPGRDTPTMVPDGMMVRQNPDGGMEIVDAQGNVDPRYNRALPGSAVDGQVRGGIVNPVMRTANAAGQYVPVGAIPPEEWAYRRTAARAAREERAASRQQSLTQNRFPGNGGGFGAMNPFTSDASPPGPEVASADAGAPPPPALTAENNPITMAVASAMRIPGLAGNPTRMRQFLVAQGFPEQEVDAWIAAQESDMSGPWDSTFGRMTNSAFRRRWGSQRGSFIPGQAPAAPSRPGGYIQSYGMGQR